MLLGREAAKPIAPQAGAEHWQGNLARSRRTGSLRHAGGREFPEDDQICRQRSASAALNQAPNLP